LDDKGKAALLCSDWLIDVHAFDVSKSTVTMNMKTNNPYQLGEKQDERGDHEGNYFC
jgi:hypothetical protein